MTFGRRAHPHEGIARRGGKLERGKKSESASNEIHPDPPSCLSFLVPFLPSFLPSLVRSFILFSLPLLQSSLFDAATVKGEGREGGRHVEAVYYFNGLGVLRREGHGGGLPWQRRTGCCWLHSLTDCTTRGLSLSLSLSLSRGKGSLATIVWKGCVRLQDNCLSVKEEFKKTKYQILSSRNDNFLATFPYDCSQRDLTSVSLL